MDNIYSVGELLPFAAALAAAGALSGFMAGLFGIGGGAVMVPVLYQVLELFGIDESVRMHLSVGTSLAVIVPTSLLSFSRHRSRGAVDMDILKKFLFMVPLGVICASIIAAYVSGAGLRALFAAVALIVAVRMLFAREDWRLGDDLPGQPWTAFTGWLIGFLSAFMGIGGGVLMNTFMTLFARPMHQAVATSAGVGVLISIPGVLGYIWAGWGVPDLPPLSFGYINLVILAVVVPAALVAAPFGVKVAHALSRRQLEISFGIFLVLVAIRFFASLI